MSVQGGKLQCRIATGSLCSPYRAGRSSSRNPRIATRPPVNNGGCSETLSASAGPGWRGGSIVVGADIVMPSGAWAGCASVAESSHTRKPGMAAALRRTKILATLGPASDPPGVLDALLLAGVDVVRLNFSHGDPASHDVRAEAVREAGRRVGREVGILADLPGPKIRIERFEQGKVQLRMGERFDLLARADAPMGTDTQ